MVSPPNETFHKVTGEARRRRAKAIERSNKLLALALRNDAHWEALSALRMAQRIASEHDLLLVVADPDGKRVDPSVSSASGCPWAPAH